MWTREEPDAGNRCHVTPRCQPSALGKSMGAESGRRCWRLGQVTGGWLFREKTLQAGRAQLHDTLPVSQLRVRGPAQRGWFSAQGLTAGAKCRAGLPGVSAEARAPGLFGLVAAGRRTRGGRTDPRPHDSGTSTLSEFCPLSLWDSAEEKLPGAQPSSCPCFAPSRVPVVTAAVSWAVPGCGPRTMAVRCSAWARACGAGSGVLVCRHTVPQGASAQVLGRLAWGLRLAGPRHLPEGRGREEPAEGQAEPHRDVF